VINSGAGGSITLTPGTGGLGVTGWSTAGFVKNNTSGILTGGNSLASGDVTTALGAAPFLQGGNSFAATATLGTKDNNPLSFVTNNSTAMTILSGGNVGIGTVSPGYKLDVNGNVNISSSSAYEINGTNMMRYPGSGNYFFGSSGNMTLTGMNNIAVGDGMASITTATDNVSIGATSLGSVTSGGRNFALGNYALYFNSTGSDNVGLGFNGLKNTTASGNTAIGSNVGFSNTTGANNTFIGFNAGYTDGVVTTSAGLSNATAIGYNAQATSSNSFVLGGTGSSAVNVGMNDTAPATRLSVVGNAQIGYASGQAAPTNGLIVNGNVGVGTASPTAALQLKSGTAAAGTSPLKLTAGTNLTALEAGAIEFDGNNLYYTDSTPTRHTLATAGSSGTVNSGSVNQLAYYSSTGSAVSGDANATISNGSLTLGQNASVAGNLVLNGSTSGAITVAPQAVAGTYNFNLPTTAGTSGWLLTSAGGAGAMTWTNPSTLSNVNGVSFPSSGSSGGIPYYSSSSSIASSGALTANGIVYGGGAGAAPSATAAMTNGQVLIGSNGAAPVPASLTAGTGITITPAAGSITIAPTTGLANNNLLQNTSGSTIASNSILMSGASGVTSLASPASGVLTSSGTVPAWSTSLGATMGGTGQTSYTLGDILYASSTSALSALHAGTATYVLTSNGAGAVPSWQVSSGGGITATSPTTGAIAMFTGATAVGNSAISQTSGAVTVTGTNASLFSAGQNGATNPALNVNTNTASSATGLGITSAAAGSGVTVTTLSSGTNEALNLQSKGSGAVNIQNTTSSVNITSSGNVQLSQGLGSVVETVGNNQWNLGRSGGTDNTASPLMMIAPSGGTGLPAGAEATDIEYNLGVTRTHNSNTAITLQRDYRIIPSTHAFATSGGVITNAAGLSVDNPPLGGTNATLTNSSAIYVPSAGVTNVTNSYGLNINASTGATNNYAATFMGGNVGVGTSSPAYTMDINGTLRSNVYLLGADISLEPISGNQSALTTWWGLQLVGNKQSSVSYTPTAIGTNSAYGVIIPNQQAGSVALMLQGASGQSGNLTQWQNSSGTILDVINSSGSVGIGVTSPSTKLQVAGEISPSATNTYSLGDASLLFTAVYATNGTIQTSDARKKKDIADSDLGLDFVNSLRPVSYHWKSGPDSDLHYGLIAQETEKAIVEAKSKIGKQTSRGDQTIISHDQKTDNYGLKYTELIGPVIKAIQDLYQQFTGIHREIASLKEENSLLKSELCKKDATYAFCKGDTK
jgi:hypothetical protein